MLEDVAIVTRKLTGLAFTLINVIDDGRGYPPLKQPQRTPRTLTYSACLSLLGAVI